MLLPDILSGLYHLCTLQKEGLSVWNPVLKRVFQDNPFLALAGADGPGIAYLNGLVGHHGAFGCRLYCPVKGWQKEGGTHYIQHSSNQLATQLKDVHMIQSTQLKFPLPHHQKSTNKTSRLTCLPLLMLQQKKYWDLQT